MVKHFTAYDQEGNFGAHDRTHFCAPLSLRDLVAFFWPPFYAAVTRGRAGGVMCAASGYGVGGAPGGASCAHGDFNVGVLRAQWGFAGAMVTDGNGVGDLWRQYGRGALNCGAGASGPTAAVRDGLRGGVDVELGETLNNFALAAVADGNITMADVDAALLRTLPWLFRLGLMDPPAAVPPAALGSADVDTAASRALAREAAAQAVVLLRNNNNNNSTAGGGGGGGGAPLVPLALGGALRRVALVGPSIDNADTLLANYHGENRVAAQHTPLAALSAAAAAAGVALTSAPGCATVLCEDASGFPAAVAAAAGAQVTIFVGGGAPWRGGAGPFNSTEGEEFDRQDIGLPGLQEELLLQLLATGAPLIVVLLRGGPIGLSQQLLSHPGLTTLVDVAYPGEMGGQGLVDVLLGTVAPSGRLATTVYAPDFVATRNITDYNFSSGKGVTHLWYTGQPQWLFGAGLSTTTWALAWFGSPHRSIAVSAAGGGGGGGAASAAAAAPPPPYAVNATNTGARRSDLSLLAFVASGVPGEPLQQLFDFNRAAGVAPGETVTLYFSLPPRLAARVGADGRVALHQGVQRVSVGAPGEQMLEGTLAVAVAVAVE
jgi:beta-glucosidase-like glycosyl hydrolase